MIITLDELPRMIDDGTLPNGISISSHADAPINEYPLIATKDLTGYLRDRFVESAKNLSESRYILEIRANDQKFLFNTSNEYTYIINNLDCVSFKEAVCIFKNPFYGINVDVTEITFNLLNGGKIRTSLNVNGSMDVSIFCYKESSLGKAIRKTLNSDDDPVGGDLHTLSIKLTPSRLNYFLLFNDERAHLRGPLSKILKFIQETEIQGDIQ